VATVYVAAGGGGDALAAAVIRRAIGHSEPAVIATYAWERLIIDPVPGPRSPADFDGLHPLGRSNHRIVPGTAPRPPAGSTLPRLATELEDDLVLLDPADGARGLRAQLAELASLYHADAITVVDVGGDAIARGDEPTLLSPLADSLALAATIGLDIPIAVLVAGAGLDGELSESQVLAFARAEPILRLGADDIAPFRAVLDWHPSEATALLAAAALGLRGRVEVRDAGLGVALTDHSADVYSLALERVIEHNRLAAALVDSANLSEAEDIARSVCGSCEIDYERSKAEAWHGADRGQITAPDDDAIRTFELDAASRGVDYVTFRRIAEATDLSPDAARNLRRHLATTRPERYVWPLWSVAAPTAATARA
jgi:hypothetical protein